MLPPLSAPRFDSPWPHPTRQKLKMKSEPNAKPTMTNFWPVANWIIFWVVFQLRRDSQILTYHPVCVSVCVCVRVLFSCCQAIKILCQCRNRNLASFAVIYRAFSASQADRKTDRHSVWMAIWFATHVCVCQCVCGIYDECLWSGRNEKNNTLCWELFLGKRFLSMCFNFDPLSLNDGWVFEIISSRGFWVV